MTLRLVVMTPCWACERREGDVPVMVAGDIVYLCETCWERTDDPDEPERPDLNPEGDPTRNGALDRW